MCNVFILSHLTGVRANLHETFNKIPEEQMMKVQNKMRTRLFFILAWLHVVIQERSQYGPLGKIEKTDFSCS